MTPSLRTFVFVLLCLAGPQTFAQTEEVAISVDASETIGPMKPIWAWFGYDEPNYTYMKDGSKLLSEIAALSPVPVYVRTHNLLTSGDGTAALKWGSTNAYTEDQKGEPVYNWTIVDSIMDTYLNRGMRPLAEIGFMPEALSVKPQPYRHSWNTDQPYNNIYTGWSYPPRDYEKWSDLVFQWVTHSIERYGHDEVVKWKWELWNEPDIKYWQGTFDEYCKLYDYTADAVKRACSACSMGGPHTTNPNNERAQKYLQDFLRHCASGKNYATGQVGSPIDFIAFHAKGSPKVVEDHVQMNMAPQLAAVASGFKVVKSFPELRDLPVIIGECDPEGCAACSMQNHPQNAYRNGALYSSYTASSYARIYELMDQYQVDLEGAVTWAFEFEHQRWFDGFRDLATNGVDKPVLNVFRMFGMMKGDRIAINNPGAISADQIILNGHAADRPDVHAIASRDERSVAIMVWNYHDDSRTAPSTPVRLRVDKLPAGRAVVHHYRIDDDHSNSYEVWKRMGSPQEVNADQRKALTRAGQLQLLNSPEWIDVKDGTMDLAFDLPRHGVSLLTLSY